MNFNLYDKYYLNENVNLEPKESFKFIVKTISEYFLTQEPKSIADVGCATANFIHFLQKVYPKADYWGFDIDQLLLDRAKLENPEVTFQILDITDENTFPEMKFDVVFMNGVTLYYDCLSLWVKNFLSLINDNGRGFIFGTFNPENVDVLIKVKRPELEDDFNYFGNLFSLFSVKNEFAKHNASLISYPFQIEIDVERDVDNPLRSWTFNDENGTKITKNGIQVIQNYYLLEVVINNSSI